MKVLFVGGPTRSAIFGISSLAKATALAGHEVFMASNEEMVPVIAAVGLPAISVTPHAQSHFIRFRRSGDPVEPLPADAMGRTRFAGRMFGRLAAASLDSLRELAKNWKPDLVIGGALAYGAPLLAAHLGVPFMRLAWYFGESDGMDSGAVDELLPELEELGLDPGLRQSHVIMAGCCGDTPRLAFARPGW